VKVLFFVREYHPTFRVDVNVLFGKYLPRFGVESDLVTLFESADAPPWPGGKVFGPVRSQGRVAKHLQGIVNDLKGLLRIRRGYDVVMVRDKPLFALFAWLASRVFRVPFAYWMSYPMPESWLEFAKERGRSVGLVRWLVVYLRGTVSYWALYRVVLPRSEYTFLQSDKMVSELRSRGIAMKTAVAVPMGVDHEAVADKVPPLDAKASEWLARMRGHETVVYLGSLERNRRLEVALQAFNEVRRERPEALMVLVGGSDEPEDTALLVSLTEELGLRDHVLFTGWLPMATAWELVKAARIGFSPCPRGPLHEVASPTKAVEYLALGLPVVANDQPDQALVVGQSGGGLCTSMEVESFAKAIVQLLSDPAKAQRMGEQGRAWVVAHRSYERLARLVAEALRTPVTE
jgi:glycosyltransferase involved in cell wall biosynthesis